MENQAPKVKNRMKRLDVGKKKFMVEFKALLSKDHQAAFQLAIGLCSLNDKDGRTRIQEGNDAKIRIRQ